MTEARTNVPIPFRDPVAAAQIVRIAESYRRLLGKPLVADDGDAVAALWHADAPIVAHGTQADPLFFFANRAALDAFEMSLDQFVGMPSRFSAEAPRREERQGLLDRVSRFGFIDNYRGIRITGRGRRLAITGGIVWNLVDPDGSIHGQAATFQPEAAE